MPQQQSDLQSEETVERLRARLAERPGDREALAVLRRIAQAAEARGDELERSGKLEEAKAHFRRAADIHPSVGIQARIKLGRTLYGEGRPDAALAEWKRAAADDPRGVPPRMNIGKVLREQRRHDEAIASYREVLAIDPRAAAAYHGLIRIYTELGRPEELIDACRALTEIAPDDPFAAGNWAAALERQGRSSEAYDLIAPFARRRPALAGIAITFAQICRHLDPPREEALAPLVEVLARSDLPVSERKEALWTLAGLCDALGRAQEAFGYLEQVKALEPPEPPGGRRAAARRIVDAAAAAYTPERLARLPRAGHGSELPVFIVGTPRSGTTLAEQILAAHPDAAGGGELRFLPQLAVEQVPRELPYPQCLDALTQARVDALAKWYLDQVRPIAPQAARIVDKMMFNFEHLGLIEILFPRARVVHCVRDPLDACLSIYMHEILNMTDSRDLVALGRWYRRYRDLMARWQRLLAIPVFTLRYETLVTAPERTVRELVAFCGLPWNDACLRFHEVERYVGTHSYHDVRQPLYTSSIGRHKAYDAFLGPLKAALAEAPADANAVGAAEEAPDETALGAPAVAAPSRDEAPAPAQGAGAPEAAARELRAALRLREARRFDEAAQALERIVAQHPGFAEARAALAESALQRNEPLRARALAEQALAGGAHAPACHYLLARALGALGETDAAIEAYRRVIALQPGSPPAYNNLGNQLNAAGRHAEAIEALEKAIALRPDYALAHFNLGNALRKANRMNDAIAAYRRALEIDPGYLDALSNLANVLKEAGRPGQALAAARRALEIDPRRAEGWNNLAVVLKDLDRVDEAIAAYRRSLELKPQLADPRLGLGMALLYNGEYEEGWKLYEARWQTADFLVVHRRLPEPLWRGESFAGRTLLVHFEQGYGDTMQLLRYVPLIAGRGGRIVLEVQRPIFRLAAPFSRWAQVIQHRDPRPAYDIQCPTLSLPLAFGTTIDTIPADVPYLFADPALAEKWKRRLGGEPGTLKAGLVWKGNPRQPSEPKRGIGLARCMPLFGVRGVRWFSLQVGTQAAEALRLPPGTIADLSTELVDFAETAAVIANLDLVITTDTAVAHLAGGLGRPTWVMLRYAPDWRWHRDRSDNPWYPGNMRLFRQPRLDDWPAAVREVKAALEEMATRVRAT